MPTPAPPPLHHHMTPSSGDANLPLPPSQQQSRQQIADLAIIETSAKQKPEHQLVICAYHGLSMLEYGAAVDIFSGHRTADSPWYHCRIAGLDGLRVQMNGGTWLETPDDASILAQADTIVIPGWRRLREAPDPQLLQALRDAAERGARLVSFCSGAFLLAHAGLLDGQSATTHWKYAELFAGLFPKVSLKVDRLYVQAGRIFTSAGSAACLDLALQLIKEDFGAERANQAARRLVIPGQRDGGQQQFIELPVGKKSTELGLVQDYALQHLHQPLQMDELAALVHMSRRSFDRKFKATFGQSPKQWLLNVRVEHAKTLLATSATNIEQIATLCGFGTAQALRDQFDRSVGISPARFRAQQLQQAERSAV
jgi:AraC family transcriptional regulator, transcriptional activator FtrA